MRKILLVDDSLFARKSFVNLLPERAKGCFTVIEADDGLKGVEMYQEHRPDIVFLDVALPGINGFLTLQKMREFDANIRIIMLTADPQDTTRDLLGALGAQALINKPITRDLMERIVTDWLEDLM